MRWFTLLLLVAACDTPTASGVVVDNAYPATADGGLDGSTVAVYRAWWVTTLFAGGVAAGASSETERTIPAEDYAYALLAPGWDPASGTTPPKLVPVRSTTKLAIDRGDTLRIRVSQTTFAGDCAAGAPLAQADADFITERIFPGAFAGMKYDAATCTTTAAADGGE